MFADVAYWFALPLFLLVSCSIAISKLHAFTLPQSFRAFALCVCLLYSYMAFSSFWSLNQDLYAVSQLLVVVLFMSCAYVFLRYETEKQLRLILSITLWTGIAYAIGAFSSYPDISGRLSAFTGGPNVFVRITGSGLIAGMYLFFQQGKRMFLWSFPLLIIAAMGSGSRGGVISLAISLLYLTIFVLPRYFEWSTLLPAGFVLGLLLWIGYVNIADSELFSTFENRYITLTETRYLSGRDTGMISAWYIFLDNPWIGAGLTSYETLSNIFTYPHNLLLHVASEGGVLGLLPLLACLFLLVYRWFQPRSVEHDFILAICLLYLLSSQISGQIYDARFIWFYGLAYMLPKRENGRTKESNPSTAIQSSSIPLLPMRRL